MRLRRRGTQSSLMRAELRPLTAPMNGPIPSIIISLTLDWVRNSWILRADQRLFHFLPTSFDPFCEAIPFLPYRLISAAVQSRLPYTCPLVHPIRRLPKKYLSFGAGTPAGYCLAVQTPCFVALLLLHSHPGTETRFLFAQPYLYPRRLGLLPRSLLARQFVAV